MSRYMNGREIILASFDLFKLQTFLWIMNFYELWFFYELWIFMNYEWWIVSV